MIFRLSKTLKSDNISNLLKVEVAGSTRDIISVGSLDSSESGCLIYSTKIASNAYPGAIIIAPYSNNEPSEYTHLISSNPRLDFIRALAFIRENGYIAGNENISVVHPEATIGPNVVIENNCVIDKDVIIEANAVIGHGSKIGLGSRIGAGSVIGTDGFGFERDELGRPIRFPHLGGVDIGNYVEIGCNNTISRGTLSNTIIEDYVKTNNLVHIAHNCRIGSSALIMASVSIAGGVTVGEQSWIGIGSAIRQKIMIGRKATIGVGAVVVRNVPDGEVHIGNPAKKMPPKKE